MFHWIRTSDLVTRTLATTLIGILSLSVTGCVAQERLAAVQAPTATVQQPIPSSPSPATKAQQPVPPSPSPAATVRQPVLPTPSPAVPAPTVAAAAAGCPASPTLPDQNIQALQAVAISTGLEFAPLAAEHTVIYALPKSDNGAVFLLTPRASPAGFSTKELAINPGMFARRVLGGLSVVRKVNDVLPALPPGNYAITLSPDARQVIFNACEFTYTPDYKQVCTPRQFKFDAVIRALPQVLPRPIALVTASQMCLAWDATQVCALVRSPLPDNQVRLLRAGIGESGIAEDVFALQRAVPDIEGVAARTGCACGLGNQVEGGPRYSDCWATVLAVPTVRDVSFPGPASRGIGFLTGLERIEEQVYLDPELTRPALYSEFRTASGVLPQGNFTVSEMRLKTDPQIRPGVFRSRVRLSGSQGTFYLPAMSGAVIIGSPMRGTGPSSRDEAVIVNLVIGDVCFFYGWECVY